MCPRTAKAYETMREASKENIMQAALEVFAGYGFEKASIRRIAQRAKVSLGLLYNYFAGKEELLIAICQKSMEDVLASFAAADKGQTPAAKLELLIKSSFEIVAQHRDFWRVFYSLRSQPGIKDKLPEAFLLWHQKIHDQLQSYFSELKHPHAEAAAWLLFATIDGIAQHYIWEENYPLAAVLETLLDTYIQPTGASYATA